MHQVTLPVDIPPFLSVQESTSMLQKNLHKDQMTFDIITESLTYEPVATLLILGSLKIILQEAAPAYPSDISNSNSYLLEYHALLVYHMPYL